MITPQKATSYCKFRVESKIIFLCVFFPLFAFNGKSEAANHYIRSGAVGANNGANWIDAWNDLPDNFARGDTYYVAGGNYGGHTFNTPVEGANIITIKKANKEDNGLDFGWDEAYASEQAVFNNTLSILTDNWVVDGVCGNGGDPSNYGFKIQINSCSGAVKGVASPPTGYSAAPSNISIKHFAIILPGSNYDFDQRAVVFMSKNNFTLSNCYLKNGSTNIFASQCVSGCVIENNYFDTNWSSPANHGQQIVPANVQNLIIRNNIFKNSSVHIVGAHVTACSEAMETNGGGHYSGCSFTEITLTDPSKNWIPNQFAGYILKRNHNNSSAYSSWNIISNTLNTITVDNSQYDLNAGDAAAHGELDDGDIYWISMSGTVSNINEGYFEDTSHIWTKEATGNNYQIGINHQDSTLYYRIGSISGHRINVLPPILISDGRANGDSYVVKNCHPSTENLQFYNNIVIGDGVNRNSSGVCSADSAYTDVLTNLKVYNNTFFNMGFFSSGWVYTGTLSDISKSAAAKNNLFYNSINSVIREGRNPGTVEKSHNCYLKSSGTIPDFGSEAGMQRDDTAESPFVYVSGEDFSITASNLAVDNGLDLSAYIGVLDHLGTPRPQGSAWDIGAYEFTSGGGAEVKPAAPEGLIVR